MLGIGFLAGQVVAWEIVQRGLMRPAGVSDSFFYILTGTHAFHVLVGVLALIYAVWLGFRHKPDEHRRIVVDVISWYWHVIGVLWIYLFALLSFSA
jgi:cytochrome c oxidase subunit 3